MRNMRDFINKMKRSRCQIRAKIQLNTDIQKEVIIMQSRIHNTKAEQAIMCKLVMFEHTPSIQIIIVINHFKFTVINKFIYN